MYPILIHNTRITQMLINCLYAYSEHLNSGHVTFPHAVHGDDIFFSKLVVLIHILVQWFSSAATEIIYAFILK
jgi:hypothetical protein